MPGPGARLAVTPAEHKAHDAGARWEGDGGLPSGWGRGVRALTAPSGGSGRDLIASGPATVDGLAVHAHRIAPGLYGLLRVQAHLPQGSRRAALTGGRDAQVVGRSREGADRVGVVPLCRHSSTPTSAARPVDHLADLLTETTFAVRPGQRHQLVVARARECPCSGWVAGKLVPSPSRVAVHRQPADPEIGVREIASVAPLRVTMSRAGRTRCGCASHSNSPPCRR